MFTEKDLEEDIGQPSNKVGFLRKINRIDEATGYLGDDRPKGRKGMPIGIYDGELPDLNTRFRTGESDK